MVVARDDKFMCSSLGQELIEKDIAELGLTRVVVAACSPHMHERTFRGACERAGLNPYLCELVSIREQVSWVHTDREAATAKAKAVVAGGVLRVAQDVPLEPFRVPINPATLVVGGGIAGISAALEIADAGFPVHLVEREPSIGGHMAQFDKTFPTLDCAACILTPKMVDGGHAPEHHAPHLERGDRRRGLRRQLHGHRPPPRPLREHGPLHRLRHLPGEVPGQGRRRRVRGRASAIARASTRPFPQAVPKYPVIDAANCIYFEKGTCKACEKFCPTGAIDFEQQDEDVDRRGRQHRPGHRASRRSTRGAIEQYGYGRLPNVFTSLEFERMSNAAGPTNGRIVLRDGVTEPKSVGDRPLRRQPRPQLQPRTARRSAACRA